MNDYNNNNNDIIMLTISENSSVLDDFLVFLQNKNQRYNVSVRVGFAYALLAS